MIQSRIISLLLSEEDCPETSLYRNAIYALEKNGRYDDKLKIRRWQDR